MAEQIIRPNGARLLLEQVPGARSACLGFFVGSGSRHETPEENGSAHFIEHMLFKGTPNRTAARLAMDMDAIGGQINAYTTKETTCFYSRSLDRHLDQALDILGDMLFHSNFAQSDVDTERGVILEEIGMYEDTPEDLVAERLSAAVYKGTPLARPILGTEDTLPHLTGERLSAWQRAHYRADNVVTALAGSFTREQVEQICALLDTLPVGENKPLKQVKFRPAVTAKRKNMEQNHLILAFPAMDYLDPRRYQLMLLNSLLGGGCSSRLFQQVREQRGLCYSVYSYVADHEDVGLLGIYTAVNPEQEGEALAIIRSILEDLAANGPTQEELDRVREQAIAGLLLGSESIQSRMSHMGNSVLLYGRVREIDEILDCYQAVTREQLQTLAREMFNWDRAALSALGKVKTIAQYTNWLRTAQM